MRTIASISSSVYIVSIAGTAAEFEVQLAGVPGARMVRELPPGRVVVVLRHAKERAMLAALPGVESVVEDRLERPT